MRLIHEDISRDLWIDDETIIFGVVDANIIVQNHGNFILDGHCKKIIVVQEGGKARIAGKVDGYVFNMGGELFIEDQAILGLQAVHLYGLSIGRVYSVEPASPEPD